MEPTQAAVIGAVGEWIASNGGELVTATTYIHDWLSDPDDLLWRPDRVPEIRGAGPPLWGPALDDESQTALENALGAVIDVEFVTLPQSVVDPNGFEVLGCRPYLGRRAMIHLSQPLPVGDHFFVEVNYDAGCEGTLHLLKVVPSSSGFEVAEISREGHWIV
jgi:hypothetical protein